MIDRNEKRIFRNSVFLYIRILISIILSLYTSRVILEVLGVRDYGIYNVVGGLIVLLSFLNETMSATTQRFLNYEMGLGKEGRLADTFSAAWAVHLGVAALVAVLGETAGLWAVNRYLVISPERMTAANWTYQFSLLGGIFTILSFPYIGAVYAHEKMNVYAVITLGFSALKLGVVLLLLYAADFDSLIIYSGLMAAVSLVFFLSFRIYCRKNFAECTNLNFRHKKIITRIVKFSGSDLAGTSGYTIQTQGILVILNRLGGTVLNAAGGLASTVTLTVNQLGSSIILAFKPQIIKHYASGDFISMQKLMVNCSKFSIILLAVFAVPCLIETEFILGVWLTEIPAHTAEFIRIALLASLSQMTFQTLTCGIHATGRIFSFSITTGIIYILMLPAMYWSAYLADNPAWIYILPVFQTVFYVVFSAIMLRKRMCGFRISGFLWHGYIFPSIIVAMCCTIVFYLTLIINTGWLRFITTVSVSTALIGLSAWIFLLNKELRKETMVIIKKKMHIA